MVLLKVLEVFHLNLEDKVFHLNLEDITNISSLVHLRYLAFREPNISVVPSSISKLQNLQILILTTASYFELGSPIRVPDFIFDMMKLRHVHISRRALFEVDNNRLENTSILLENLRFLSEAYVSCGDSSWLSKLLGLETLHCVLQDPQEIYDMKEFDDRQEIDDLKEFDDVQEIADLKESDDRLKKFPKLSFNGNLTSLKVKSYAEEKKRFVSTCQLPTNLRKLTLMGFFLTSNDISEIGRELPHLEVFKIIDCSVPDGYEWNVGDNSFQRLKVLKLRSLKLSKWIASENSFPSLQQLWLEKCNNLDEIPLDFGYLLNLRLISARECAPSVDHSAREIEKMQHEDQNTDMKVHIYQRN